jgi:hypothetical protein
METNHNDELTTQNNNTISTYFRFTVFSGLLIANKLSTQSNVEDIAGYTVFILTFYIRASRWTHGERE